MDVSQATADRIFEAACTATFRRTNLGLQAEVKDGSYTYYVQAGDEFLACIDGRDGYGGAEYVFTNATPEQDRALREAIASQDLE
ncbi:hypothetical protein [Streptomyces sp. AC1-42T]|uniref:hypothetical protein n=1 Tax=Streptomyces sp. AC1-42T TaxID=2218665 RepID=UPI000DACCF78|nr:hypothetical protein [Streptomyces sp. AC1-42T]PZT71523.1 hypothetical protein DNK55_32955 [Streptomyces sp. AC1-42T]